MRLDLLSLCIGALVTAFADGSACLAATAVPPSLRPSLTFQAAFDGSAVAESAKGNATPVALRNVTFARTAHGQGMYVGKDATCAYATAGNLAQAEGTLSLWLIPKGWGGGDSFYTYFFECRKDDKNTTVLYKQSNYNGYFIVTVDGKVNYCGLAIGDCRDGEPLHIVCTWGAFGRLTYVDGEVNGHSPSPVSAFGPTFSIGCSGTQPGYVIVDEVHVFDRALTAAEVLELFRVTMPANWQPEGQPR